MKKILYSSLFLFLLFSLTFSLAACGSSGYSDDAYKKAYSDAYKAAYQEGYNKGFSDGKEDIETKTQARFITGEYQKLEDAEKGANYAFVTGLYVGYIAKEQGYAISPGLGSATDEIEDWREDSILFDRIHDNVSVIATLYLPELAENDD